MTADRDADRITRAWLEQMPSEMPDRVLAGVLQAVESAPQVRLPLVRAIRRSSFMTRLTLYGGAAAAALVVVIGGAMLLGGNRPSTGGPSSSPTSGATLPPTTAPTLAPTDPPSAPPSVTLPEELQGPWAAVAPTGGDFPVGTTIRWITSPAGITFSVKSTELLQSTVDAVAGLDVRTLQLRLVADGSGCRAGDIGVYGWAVDAAAGTLSLTYKSDACQARAMALARPWFRALDAQDTLDTTGGRVRGIVSGVDLPFLVTLTEGRYQAFPSAWSFQAEDVTPGHVRSFLAVVDPWGIRNNCTRDGGGTLRVDPTIDAFSAYLATLPGFTVKSEAISVAGATRAVRLVVPTTKTAECGSRVWEWSESASAFTNRWFISQGDTDVIYLIERDGHLLLVQWRGEAVTKAEEMQVISSISFDLGVPLP